MEQVKFSDLEGMSDEELGKALGHQQELEEFRQGLQEIKALSGKARKSAEAEVERMFAPNVHPGELKYIAREAKRSARSADEELQASEPGDTI